MRYPSNEFDLIYDSIYLTFINTRMYIVLRASILRVVDSQFDGCVRYNPTLLLLHMSTCWAVFMPEVIFSFQNVSVLEMLLKINQLISYRGEYWLSLYLSLVVYNIAALQIKNSVMWHINP